MNTFLKILKVIVALIAVFVILLFIIRSVNKSRTEKLQVIKPETIANPIYKEVDRNDPMNSKIPGVEMTKVKGDYINGYRLLPENISKKGVVVTFGGSEGSSDILTAAKIAKQGYEVYSMHFFGQDNQQKELMNVPIDFFEELKTEIDKTSENSKPLTVIGSSKGAELALLLASKYPDDIDNIVLYAPSAYVFNGLSEDRTKTNSSWNYKGKEIEFLSFTGSMGPVFGNMMKDMIINEPMRLEPLYSDIVKNAPNLEAASIDISAVKANTLIFAGKDDQMWNSYEMGKIIKEKHTGECELIAYDNVGHIFFGPPVMEGLAMGGEYEANEKAGKDSDKKLLEALDKWTK